MLSLVLSVSRKLNRLSIVSWGVSSESNFEASVTHVFARQSHRVELLCGPFISA